MNSRQAISGIKPPTRRQPQRDAMRTRLLTAARKLLARSGVAALSLRAVARAAGCVPGNVYVYFPGKHALLSAVVEESFARLHDALATVTAPAAAPVLARIRRAMHLYVEFGLSHPADYEVAFMLGRARAENGVPSSHLRPAFRVLETLLEEAESAGLRRTGSRSAVAQSIWASLHGLTSLLITHRNFPWVERQTLVRMHIASILAGHFDERKVQE